MQKIINAETLAGVHTHKHTHTGNFRKNKINRRSKQNKPIK